MARESYDAIVIGTRAYAVRDDLRNHNRRLLDYVEQGGNLVVLYNTPEFRPREFAPFPGELPRRSEEVTEEDSGEYQAEHICEPSPDSLLGELLPRSVHVQLHSALLETSTSEHAARMAAMDNATKACNDFIENLTLLYNKARQAAITAELMDIVGGAEALKG